MDWQYPETLEVSIKDIMCIYSSQTLGNMIIPRFSVYSSEDFNIASFFGGENSKDMAILLLNKTENGRVFKLPLIEFFYNILGSRIDIIKTKEEFEDYFKINHENPELNNPYPVQIGSFEDRFDVFLNIFNNFIKTIDKRLIQIENLILKITDHIQK